VLERETSFMLLEPDERTTTEPEAAEELRSTAARPNSVVFVADSGRARGYVEPNGGAFQRNLKTAYVVIGVRRSHAAGGIGRQLLSELERWAHGKEGVDGSSPSEGFRFPPAQALFSLS
jgi:GNAT superfamily N-acetyltransferase